MTGRGTDLGVDAAGGPARHRPVLLAEVAEALDVARGGVFLDGTFGAGGYTGGSPLVARSNGRLDLIAGCFDELDILAHQAGHERVDGVVLDIGVSSMQLDTAERGFSFRHDAPLDMRMAMSGRSAADIVNEAEEGELADILYHFGEERRSRAIARGIVERRRREPFTRTLDLANLVASYVRSEPGLNPATRTFQGLRIAVNDELGQLTRALDAAERVLKPGGRLVVVTFHSLEDRIVKQFMQDRTSRMPRASRHLPSPEPARPTFTAVTRGPVTAGDAELARNPRARSAKLRAAERTDAPPRSGSPR
jgi:16S rRNA (cytosine1402-N4)-methyltransferase